MKIATVLTVGGTINSKAALASCAIFYKRTGTMQTAQNESRAGLCTARLTIPDRTAGLQFTLTAGVDVQVGA